MSFGGLDPDLPALFGARANFDGDGKWFYEPYNVIRTVRPGMPTVFVMAGTVDPTKLPLTEELAALQTPGGWKLSRPINLYHWEFLYITFIEPFTNMAAGHAAGKAELMAQISLLEAGQKFAIVGASEGAAVCSDVYDELRTGTLTAKAADFLGGFMVGNPRRQNGRTFTDPVQGLYPDPLVGSSGAAPSRLTGTENKWWEMCSADDPVTCVSDTSDLGWWIRRFYELVHQEGGTTQAAVLAEVKANASNKADGDIAVKLFSNLGATGHVKYHIRSPFVGDSRNFWQCGIDYINSLSTTTATPVVHQLRSDSRVVKGGQLVTGGAQFRWMNFPPFTGQAIKVGISAYDVAGTLLADVFLPTATITNPKTSSADWFGGLAYKTLTGRFKMPPQAVEAKLLIEVAPEVMGTGIMWFREPRFV